MHPSHSLVKKQRELVRTLISIMSSRTVVNEYKNSYNTSIHYMPAPCSYQEPAQNTASSQDGTVYSDSLNVFIEDMCTPVDESILILGVFGPKSRVWSRLSPLNPAKGSFPKL